MNHTKDKDHINGFLQGLNGGYSNSRLIADIIIGFALVFAQEVIYFGHSNIILTATSAGTIFITVAGPALAFLFVQKKQEFKSKEEEDVNKQSNIK